jgi:GNAT superfamily N-acetyltransferase
MRMMWALQAATDTERAACEAILRSLPEWFGIEEAIQHYAQEIRTRPTYVAVEAGQVCGFVTLYHHNTYTSEIYVMAVRKEHHRRGIGRALIAQAETVCRQLGVEYLQVKTLGSSHPSVEYAQTRLFYLACGFRPLEEFDGIWPGNPCLILVKRL